MDDGIKKIERGIEALGLWFRLSVMLALGAACLLALRSLRTREAVAAERIEKTVRPALGSRDELEPMLAAELPMEFIGIIIQGEVSQTTAIELYQQHHARFEILSWQYHPSTSIYDASIKLSWQPDATPGPGEDFWVIAQCSVSKGSNPDFRFKVREASPDHEKAYRAYSDVLLKYSRIR